MKKERKRIFLIEDDPSTIDVYTTAFKDASIDVEVAIFGKEAVKRIKDIRDNKEKKPDIIIIDLILPDTNGIEILRNIKEDDKIKDIPVLVVSNYTDFEQQKLDGIEPEKFILKTSITPTKLAKLIEAQLKKFK